MSITLANAKAYVAGILGGQDDANLLVAAGDAITSAISKWNRSGDGWTFCLKDGQDGFTVTGCTIAANLTTVTSSSLDIYGVNQGVTATSSTVGLIPASTTVASVTRSTVTGALLSFELSTPASASATGVSMSFTGDIPIVAGISRYSLPSDFNKPYTARLLTNKRVLTYIKNREVVRKVADLSAQGIPTHYTTYNQNGFNAATEHKNLVLFRTPSSADTLRMMYYRDINAALDPLDLPVSFIYPVLHLAQFELVRSKNADDARLAALGQTAKEELLEAINDDAAESEDEDIRLLSQMEVGSHTGYSLDIWDDIV